MAKKNESPIINGTEDLTINGTVFADMRRAFDKKLKELVEKITSKNIQDGTISVKIGLNLQENDSEDEPNTSIYIPTIQYKITASYTEKVDESGVAGGADVQFISDGADKGWFARNDPHGQMSLDLGQ